jgi:opacity protein-like surface antigen
MRTRKGLIAPLNDRTALGQSDPSPRFDADDWSVAGSSGAGVEYFVAYNIALGIESKYVFEHPDVQIGTMNTDFGLDSILLTVGLRVFYP